jgi:hypothetical protein
VVRIVAPVSADNADVARKWNALIIRSDRPFLGLQWKCCCKHQSPAFRLILGGLVLNHIPVLRQNAVLYSQDIGGDPVHRQAEFAKPSVDNHPCALGKDQSGFVPECGRGTANEIKKALPPGFDMCAVLNVAGRPELLGCCVVPLVEEGIESFEDKILVCVPALIRFAYDDPFPRARRVLKL